ncbi:DUF885 domain-containing protein [Sphingomonas jatrophae]|uniref:Uncharacterized conserved protein, DUF885 familyt n=1 Tax=Sphingomonas jatrophae TaxID=1166337 RepID=A0A1I6K9S2_9SPHN|nr:DUF885 family protein [Sphingomonas jatrophae]SFR87937.1 Uncharacterized conserved protein, DUF885 familyt [Sphingomonas jatrophae]
MIVLKQVSAIALAFAASGAIAAPAQPAAPAAAPGSADAQLRQLYETEWAWRQKELARLPDDEPWMAGDDHFPKVDPASQQARIAYWQKTLAALDRIPVDRLSPEERINAAVFRTSLEAFVADGPFRVWEMPFNADSNFWSGIAPRAAYAKPEQYRRYLGRLRDLPRYFDEQIANMRAGLARGFSVPKATLGGRDASIAAYTVADPATNPFYAPFEKMPATIPAAEQAAMQAEARQLITGTVVPAYAKLLDFYRNEYLAKTRTTLAAEKMPGGAAFYQAQIHQFTTLDLTAEQIHAIGLKEVARITAEMEAAKAKAGFTGTLDAFKQFLRTDPQFYAKTPDELMGVSAYIAKRMDGELKNTIGFLPRYRFTIRPVPDAIAPFYTAGRGGLESCLMNTHNLSVRPLYQIPALTLHECVPGHSFQAAVAREGPNRPEFRKQTYFSGYGEGWGLYTEWLGTVAGIYRTPYEDFGRLSYEMWRACRLVIDTGIHHYGWSRDKAIDYLLANTALSRHEVETEVDRYISWPGQALAYKLGEMTIRRKRADAEAKLGAKFDQRWFHDLILNLGSVPLPVLEQQIDGWIAAGGPDTLADRK